MDAGTNALDILNGRVFPLKLGYVGVINRSQQDTVANKPIIEALKFERQFFGAHPAYSAIAYRCGTSHLTKTLNNVIYFWPQLDLCSDSPSNSYFFFLKFQLLIN